MHDQAGSSMHDAVSDGRRLIKRKLAQPLRDVIQRIALRRETQALRSQHAAIGVLQLDLAVVAADAFSRSVKEKLLVAIASHVHAALER